MKFKITDENTEEYNNEFKIRRMNFNQVVVDYPGKAGIKTFKMESGELVSDGEVDDIIKKHLELLKIKINRGTSALFYKDLIDALEDNFEKVEKIIVLNDFSRGANKRGIWDKNILLYLNDSYPIKIEASGRNFREESYKFNIKVIEEPEFLETCDFNVEKLEEQIAWRSNQIDNYKKIVEKIEKESNFEEKCE
ncbi:hypothetical protein [Clostridium sp. B9]|uniref:hypothetical protein n=1 Tax=Clostridium sp. B9 TaxID=3423224 RepID=UPI003D2F409E